MKALRKSNPEIANELLNKLTLEQNEYIKTMILRKEVILDHNGKKVKVNRRIVKIKTGSKKETN